MTMTRKTGGVMAMTRKTGVAILRKFTENNYLYFVILITLLLSLLHILPVTYVM
jgi:hypothetical protein